MSNSSASPFRIASGEPAREPVHQVDPGSPALDRVAEMVGSSEVFLFMKGTPERPLCGFSANTVAILDALGVRYSSFDVLSDDEVRAAAKEYGSWPTFPQLYVRGELVGGNDIVSEMLATGELQRLLGGVPR